MYLDRGDSVEDILIDKVRSGLEHCHFGYACITCTYHQSSDVSKIECSTTLGEEAVFLIDEL